jgi:hypothetical protein
VTPCIVSSHYSRAYLVDNPLFMFPQLCLDCHRSLVTPLLTSSHQGWGVGSLDQDAAELALLARCLRDEWGSEASGARGCDNSGMSRA